MKKYFIIAAVALVALASCSKNEINDPNKSEISFKAVTAKATKAIINNNFYAPGDPAFGVWGLYQATNWATNHSASVWVGTDASNEAQITYQTDTWKNAAGTDYWPLSGSIVFMGYTPYANVNDKAAISVADNKVTLTISDFQSSTGTYVDDLMWSVLVFS